MKITGRITFPGNQGTGNATSYAIFCFFSQALYMHISTGAFAIYPAYLMLVCRLFRQYMVIICVFSRMSERVGERTFVKGECATYHLILQNASFLYMPYITIHMQMEGRFILKSLRRVHLSLAPFSRREFKYSMPLYFRGRYDIGVNYIEIQDLLGMVSIRLSPFEKKSILVKPRVIEQINKDIEVARLSRARHIGI